MKYHIKIINHRQSIPSDDYSTVEHFQCYNEFISTRLAVSAPSTQGHEGTRYSKL